MNSLRGAVVAMAFAFVATRAPAQVQDRPPAAKRGRVIGVVRDKSGEPWGGATVVLFARAQPTFAWVDDKDLVTAETDERGKFHASVLRCRRYSVWAHTGGDARAYRVTGIAEDVIAGVPVRLRELGEPRPRTRIRIVGRDVWKHRAPLRARLWSHHPRSVWLQPITFGKDATALLPVLPGDGCFVDVYAGDGAPLWTAFVPLTAERWERYESTGGRKVTKNGEDGVLELRIPAPAKVEVTVKDKAGKPIANAEIKRDLTLVRGPFEPVTKTDENGVAEVELAPEPSPFEINLLATKPGLTRCFQTTTRKGPAGLAQAVPMKMFDGGTLRGRVLFADGQPAAKLELLLYSPVPTGTSYNMWVGPLPYETDGQGRFEIPGMSAKYRFRLEAVPTPEQLARTRLADLSGTAIVLAVGAEGADKDYGDLRIDALQRVDIRVRGSDVRDRFQVLAAPIGGGGVRSYYCVHLATDRKGDASMLVPVGTNWGLIAGARGAATTAEVELPAKKGGRRVVEMAIDRSRTVSGIVVDGGGEPAAGARVQMLNANVSVASGRKWRQMLAHSTAMRSASGTHATLDGSRFFSNAIERYRRCRFWAWFATPGDWTVTDEKGRFLLVLPMDAMQASLVATLPKDGAKSAAVRVKMSLAPVSGLRLTVPR